MYVYNIGYDTYEESDHKQFYHEKQLTASQIEDMISEIVINLLELEDNEHTWGITFQHLFYDICEHLEKEYGFIPIAFEANVQYFGWAKVTGDDWVENDTNTRLTNSIPQHLKEKFGEFGDKDE